MDFTSVSFDISEVGDEAAVRLGSLSPVLTNSAKDTSHYAALEVRKNSIVSLPGQEGVGSAHRDWLVFVQSCDSSKKSFCFDRKLKTTILLLLLLLLQV